LPRHCYSQTGNTIAFVYYIVTLSVTQHLSYNFHIQHTTLHEKHLGVFVDF